MKIANQRQHIKEQNKEIEQLKRAVTHHPHSDNDDNSDEEEHITKKTKHDKSDDGALRTQALHAGKRYTVCNSLWINPAVLGYLALLSKADSGSNSEPDEDSIELKELATAIYGTLPGPLRPHVGSQWFSARVGSYYKLYLKTGSDHHP
jgi:hypothetical protein